MSRDYKHKQSPASGAAPGWVWMMVGLIIGLAVAVAVHLRGQQNGPPTAATDIDAQEDASAELDGDQAEFTFYDLLPNFEVVIPEEETAIGAGPELAPLVVPGLYVLQVGSFQQEEDADRLRAQLALLGIESGIQRVTIDDDQTWHRVRVGPIADLGEVNRLRERLRTEQIEPLVIRVGD
jgi:SPOR domain